MYVEFVEGQKFASLIADKSPMHEAFQDAGYCLLEDDLIVDIDCLDKEAIEKMVQLFSIRTQIVWTDRGAHLYYKKPKGFRGARSVCPLGFEVEYKHMANTKAITIKRNGKLRDIENMGVREELPSFLYIRSKLDSLLGLDEGDGRNQKLYAHKFKIMQVDLWRKCLSYINQHVFASPMEPEEFATVCREEEIRAEKDREYEVAMALKNKLKVVKYKSALHLWNGTKHVRDDDMVMTTVGKFLQGQKVRYIREVIDQMVIHTMPVQEPPHGFDVRFKNGLLRNGNWYDIESQEFTPYYIDLEYNEDAEVVQDVEDYLTFLTDGDAEYRQLVLEVMGHALITDAEVKRQLAKFFVFIGDGGNGKGTMLTIMRKIIGSENCSSLSPEEMTKEQYFTTLQGKLVNLGDDIEDKAINEKQMKALKNISTCDYVSSRELYKQSQEVVITTSLVFTSNHLLKSFEKGESYKRRVIWMPMFGKIVKKDPRFITKLTTPEALQYWVKLMIGAYMDLYNNKGFTESSKVNEYNSAYHEENNGTLTFVRDYSAADFMGMKSPEVFEMYERWADENGVTIQSKKILRETLEVELGLILIPKKVNGKTARVFDLKPTGK